MSVETEFGVNVIGGTSVPMVLETGPELCRNGLFDREVKQGAVMWEWEASGATLTREAVTSEFGDYAMKIASTVSTDKATYAYEFMEPEGPTYGILVGFWAKVSPFAVEGKFGFSLGAGAEYETRTWTTDWAFYSHFYPLFGLLTETFDGALWVWPRTTAGVSPYSLWIQRVSIRTVLRAMTFALPDGYKETVRVQAKDDQVIGTDVRMVEDRRRLRQSWQLSYPYWNRTYASYGRYIQAARRLCFYPQSDKERWYDVMTPKTAGDEVFKSKYLGYAGGLTLEDMETFTQLPRTDGWEF